MPVVTAATVIDLEDGTTVILIMYEVLWLGNSQYTSLLNLNQVRYAGHQADDIPLFLSQGSSIHGIKTKGEFHIPFALKGKSSLMYIRTLTAREMEECEHIELTSDEPWDPTDVVWEENEEKVTRSTVMRGTWSRLFTWKTKTRKTSTPWSRPSSTTC